MGKSNEEKTVKAYKGFDSELKCRDFQYEVGKEYEMDGEIDCCSRGFHACESPLEVLGYYFLDKDAGFCRFCEVEQSGKMNKDDDGSTKIASSKIKIKAELKFADLIKLGIEWIQKKTRNSKDKNDNGGHYAKIGSSGDYAQIGSSGYYAQIGSSGNSATIGSSGNSATIGSSGYYAKIGSSGHYAKIGSSGHSATIGSSGNSATIGSSGHYAKIGSSGHSAKIGSSGDYATIGSSGYSAKIGSSGHSAKIGSSGNYAKIGSSGHSAKIGSSGDSAQINATGEGSVICCAGIDARARAKKGSWITLSEWRYNKEKGRNVPVCVKTEQVDGERIKEDTWYQLKDGEFVECSID